MDAKTHNGKFTLANPKTGNHRTFLVKTQPMNAEFAPGQRVVYLLTEGDENWKAFAFMTDHGCRVWRKLHGSHGEPSSWQMFGDMLTHQPHYEDMGVVYEASVKCRRCNRDLTNPNSLEMGIGPECATKV